MRNEVRFRKEMRLIDIQCDEVCLHARLQVSQHRLTKWILHPFAFPSEALLQQEQLEDHQIHLYESARRVSFLRTYPNYYWMPLHPFQAKPSRLHEASSGTRATPLASFRLLPGLWEIRTSYCLRILISSSVR